MKRLLLVASEFPPGPGGIGSHAFQMAQYMHRSGWSVHVLTLQDYVNSKEVMEFNSLQEFKITQLFHASNRVKEIWHRWKSLQDIIRGWRPDVLVVTGDRQVWLVALMQLYSIIFKQYKLAWCAVWHGMLPPHPIAKQFSRWSFGQADLTISVSEYSLRKLKEFGARPKKNLVITNGADEERFFPDSRAGAELRKELGLSDAQIILTVGNLTERKGQDLIIRALPEILKTTPNVHYLLAGLPTLRATLEDLAQQLGVSEHVHFMGSVSLDVLKSAYNACDIFALTSRHSSNGEFEGFGIVAVEAALCSKPAIVAGNSGLAEAVQDGETGIVIPENDSQAAERAIQTLLSNISLRKQMGDKARQRALAEQTWSACMLKYDQALTQMIKDRL